MRKFPKGALVGLAIVVSGVGFGAASNAATFTVYTDLASWQAAAGSSVVEDFSDTTLIPGLSITFGTFLPGAIGGGVYTDEAVNNTGDVFGPGNPVMNYAPGTGTTAFGADWDLDALQSGLGGGIFLQVHLVGDGNQSTPVFIDTLQPGFVGFVSDTSFDQIVMGTSFLEQETFSMDNARFATGESVVPLPAALPLFAGGLGLMGWLARRRRGQAATA